MDARLIIQVLVNLINNAIKYTPENSNISLNARRVEDKILIEVQDDGNGVLHP
ncbi:ATP-binding protein, partial [Streptococcus pyogenes]